MHRWIQSTLLCLFCWHAAAAGAEPPLQLARIYDFDRDPAEFWISEKLDGVRAYWNGQRLLSRSGRPIEVPAGFLADFPNLVLDGELWAGRGQFERIAGLIHRQHTTLADWAGVRFMVFDLPASGASFDQRLSRLRTVFASIRSARIALVEQFRAADRAALQAHLARVIESGGEGLMLHHQDAWHSPNRTANLLKLKPHTDAEARVIAHLPGQGRLEGLLGALLVAMPSGLTFRLGGGFTDAERRSPPPIGASVSYRYQGLTAKGLPRFARFLRVRPAE